MNSLLITPAASTYLRFLKLSGLCNDVLTHPHRYASYAIPVRQGNLLQSGLLQCMDHSKPPCHLLKLQDVTPAFKRLSLSGFFLKELYSSFRAHTFAFAKAARNQLFNY